VRSDAFSVTVDSAFKQVIAGCAAPQKGREDTWINRRIHDLARADPSRAGMGTTITAAIVEAQSEEVGIGHVGDSTGLFRCPE